MAQSILVPMDHSPPSKAALKHALSAHTDAEITVLHIETTGSVAYTEGVVPPVQTAEAKENTEQLFAEAQQLAEDRGAELSTVAERGVPARAINTFISNNKVDHVIMGSHGRTGVSRLFFGSVAERVVRRAPVPVTVVR